MIPVVFGTPSGPELLWVLDCNDNRAWYVEKCAELHASMYGPASDFGMHVEEVLNVDDPDMVRSDVPSVHVRGLRDGVV